jgi:hypothetical protein
MRAVALALAPRPEKSAQVKIAFRHGLTKPYSSAKFDREVETLARQIAGDTEDRIIIAFARDAVEAVLELARVRRAKIALIERATALGRFDVSKVFQSPKDEFAGIMLHFHGLPEMPSQEPERAEALRRILPELVKLHRYESRAVTRRDKAIHALRVRYP